MAASNNHIMKTMKAAYQYGESQPIINGKMSRKENLSAKETNENNNDGEKRP
jgi:hypothetical protein